MVVQMQVLSVDSVEMAPCLLLSTESQRYALFVCDMHAHSPSNHVMLIENVCMYERVVTISFLFNVGDGTQRMCMEHHVRLAKLKHVFLTELRTHTVGGLPGMVLTVSDTGKDALHVYGPPGTQQYLTATRHFLYRPNFVLKACEVQAVNTNNATDGATAMKPCYSDDEVLVYAVVTGRSKAGIKRKLHECSLTTSTSSAPEDRVTVVAHGDTSAKQPSASATECVSYVVETQPQRGKFLVEKARALGVPKGKLFGQLHQGKDVTLPDGRVVKSQDCVTPTLPATGCAVIACPSLEYVDELVKDTRGGFSRYQIPVAIEEGNQDEINGNNKPEVQLEAIYHLASEDMLRHPKYVAWVKRFGADVDHVLLSFDGCPQKTVYRASAKLQAQLQTVFPRAFPSNDIELHDAATPLSRTVELPLSPKKPVILGESMLKYTVTPAARRGFDTSNCFNRLDFDEVRASTAVVQERLSQSTDDSSLSSSESQAPSVKGRITFLGTGCAIPSKYRNVTGMYLEIERPASVSPGMNATQLKPKWDGMMFDCGEGSFGQLSRYANGDKTRLNKLVNKLKCIWISHNHADHHLGTMRMLSARSRDQEPLLIIGPTPVQFWLSEYAEIDPTVAGKYRFVDNYVFNELDARFEEAIAVSKPTRAWLREALGITQFDCVPVKHAFLSYALVVSFQSDAFKLAFSGDCRPSDQFAAKANGAFLMIHEATFEDAMAHEAKSKDHCTTAEAIDVGKKARAKHVVLTHFSQRYPKMPVMENGSDVLTAIDMLSLRFDELHQPLLMDVCSELMTTGDEAEGEETENGGEGAKATPSS